MTSPKRAYSWGQYAKALGFLTLFGWLAGAILMTIFCMGIISFDKIDKWLIIVLFLGIPAAALVSVVFLSVPLWVFMKWPITLTRACLAGFLTSIALILGLHNDWVWLGNDFPPSSHVFWMMLWDAPTFGAFFVLLCTLSAGAVQRIIGPGGRSGEDP